MCTTNYLGGLVGQLPQTSLVRWGEGSGEGAGSGGGGRAGAPTVISQDLSSR